MWGSMVVVVFNVVGKKNWESILDRRKRGGGGGKP